MRQSDAVLEWVFLHRTHTKTWDEYVESLNHDFRQIEPFLPETCESILDIGCGMAGIDILLKQKYPEAKLFLLDGDGPKEQFRGGYKEEMVPFNSRKVAKDFLKLNGVQIDRWYEIGTKETLRADLVVSLYSWGWHYPLETYKVEAKTIICDVRGKPKGTMICPIVMNEKLKGHRCKLQ